MGLEKKEHRTCRICRHPERDAIDIMLFNGRSFHANARLIERQFGLKVNHKTVKNHVSNHTTSDMAEQMAIMVEESEGGEDSDLSSAVAVGRILLSKVLKKLAVGEIEVRNLNDALRVVTLVEAQERRLQELNAEGHSDQTVENAFRQLGYIMTALREVVPEEYLSQAVKRAWSLGLDDEIASLADVPLYQLPPHPDSEVDMEAMVKDIEETGKKRSREELMEDGHFNRSAIPPGG